MTTKHNEKNDAKQTAKHKNEEGEQQQPLDNTAYTQFMSKLSEAEKKMSEAEQKAAQHWDRILRMQAETDNAARRTERDLANAHKFALERFLTELLPVIDNLERAITAAQESPTDTDTILEGVNLTLKMLYSVLEKANIQQIDPLHKAFDPTYHQAISTQADASHKPGTVLSVLQKGYLLNERLVRPALVVVSK